MRALPLDIGVIHFVGIGGIGMSGIAEILHNLGYKVRGSDLNESYVTKHLQEIGIPVEFGHRAENLADASVVVISTAVKPDNPEVVAARAKWLPVVRRAEMLAELMRLKWSIAIGGTHGKTTTTSLVAALIDAAGFDPTVINGGIINNYGTNARLGAGDWMVVEADESDGSFLKLPAVIAIVTNMDPEHLDHYGSVEAMNHAYEDFVRNIPFYGFATLCIDHPVVQAMIPRLADRRIITYGFSPQADVRATDLQMDPSGATYNVVIADRIRETERTITGIRLPMLGQHNVQNSLAAIAVASLALTGCPSVLAPETPKEIPIAGKQNTVKDGTPLELIVDGTVYGTADLSADFVIKADVPDFSSDIGLYHVAATPGARKVVENAVVTLKGYDWKIVPLLGLKLKGAKE